MTFHLELIYGFYVSCNSLKTIKFQTKMNYFLSNVNIYFDTPKMVAMIVEKIFYLGVQYDTNKFCILV